MYGTIARLKVKSGGIEALKGMVETMEERPAGAVAEYAYQMDADPDELYLAVVFEDKESYVANAQSPEQHARFEKMMEWLVEEPEWHDGEIIYAAGPE